MKIRKAHIELLFFYLIALSAYFYVYSQYSGIENSINEFADSVTVSSSYGFYLLSILLPFIHLLSCIKKKYPNAKYFNFIIVLILLFLFLAGFIFNSWLESEVLNAGYTYCDAQSRSMRFTDFNVYLKEGVSCLK